MSNLSDHPHGRDLPAILRLAAGALQTSWDGPVYRCVAPGWARPEHLINGEGTRQYGSRWMRPGLARVVHAASSEAIALKESRSTIAYYGIRKPRKSPRVCVEIQARLRRVADLRKLDAEISWPHLRELLAEDWEKINAGGVETLSQSLGRALANLGFEALVVPSARDRRGRNLVWFPDRLQPDSQISISDEKILKDWLKRRA